MTRDLFEPDWVWLMAMVLKCEQEKNDDVATDFWNWCIDRYQPEGFERIED